MELAVFVSGTAEMAHNIRPYRALGRNHKANIVFQGFLEQKPSRLTILLGEFGKLLIEMRIHLQADLFRECFGHVDSLSCSILLAGST